MTDQEADDFAARQNARQAAIRGRKNKKKRKVLYKRLSWLSISVLVFLLDQLSKWAVMEKFFRPMLYDTKTEIGFLQWYMITPEKIPEYGVRVNSFFNLVMAWNKGVSFSMFAGVGGYTPYILSAVAIGIAIMFLVWLWKAEQNFQGICYALVIGGAIGNVADRLRYGAVIDFLDFHVYGIHWPAFNIADMAVVIGIVMLIIVSFFFEFNNDRRYRKVSKEKRKFREFIRQRFGR